MITTVTNEFKAAVEKTIDSMEAYKSQPERYGALVEYLRKSKQMPLPS